MGTPYLGEIRIFPYNFAPRGWAACQGQLLPINQNTALFALIGTFYGGNGTSNFALPDLRGRFPIGNGQGTGLQNYSLGEVGGVEAVTLTTQQLPAHNHGVGVSDGAPATTSRPSGAYLGRPATSTYSSTPPGSDTLAGPAITNTGAGQAHENRQPFLVIGYYIAMVGIFPTRS